MSDAVAPEVYVRFGEELLGPWMDLDPELQESWVSLQGQVDDQASRR